MTIPRLSIRRPTWLIFILTLFVVIPASAPAIGIIVPRRPGEIPPELKSVDISGQVKDHIARTRITQVFHNNSAKPVEADFYFPVPDGADITDFVLYMNGKPVKGEVLDKDKASDTYRDIVRKMKDPGLVEWVEKNLFRVRVFPIPAGSDQKMEIEVSQALTSDQGYYRYEIPLETGAHPSASSPPTQATIQVKLSADSPLRNVYSPTHKIDMDTSNSRAITVTAKDVMAATRKDFILYYGVSEKNIAVNLLTHRTGDDPGYFSLRISPPWDDSTTDALKQHGDYVFVLDSSGSMNSGKMEQARKALEYCVNLLGEKDRFNIIRFSTSVEPFRPALQPATSGMRGQAVEWIKQIRSHGGTNISDALETAVEQRTSAGNDKSRLFTIVFITDGLPTVGETSADAIINSVKKETGGNTRIFTFGVGNDVNTRLLDSLANATRATSDYVAPTADLEVPISRFFDKVNRPALFNLELKIPNADITEVYPLKLPDLFYGTELSVYGRYKTPGKSPIILTGTIAGEKKEFRFEKDFAATMEQNPFVEKLWATRKVAALLDQVRNAGESDELRVEITELANKYGIVTPYTSYLAMEDKAAPAGAAANHVALRTGGRRSEDKASASRGFAAKRQRSLNRFTYDAANGTVSTGDVYQPAADAGAMLGLESGSVAVTAARKLNQMKTAEIVTQPATPPSSDRQTINGKLFIHKNGVWRDQSITGEEAVIVKIRYMSDSWFQLSEDFPQLRDYLALGNEVQARMPNGSVLEITNQNIDSAGFTDVSKLGLRKDSKK